MKNILFNYDWRECLREHSAEVRLEVYEAVMDYLATGTCSNLKPTSAMAFSFIKKDIDDMKERTLKRSNAAKKKAKNTEQCSAMLSNAQQIAAEKEEIPTEKVTQKELPEEEKEQEKDIDKSISKKKFIKPTEEEVAAYCKERNNNISATQFMAYYESNGWKVGRDSMKDWKAAVRYWEQTRKERKQNYSVSRTDSRAPLPKDFGNGYYEKGGFEI